MTKKDFKEVAAVIRTTSGYVEREYMTKRFIFELSKTYERFDAEKFREACGVLPK